MREILEPARAGGYAVGGFEFWSLDSARAVVEAAEEAGMPVVLQAGPLEIAHAGLDNLSRIARMVAEPSPVEVALHLDHGDSVDLARAAIEAGFTSVMLDASALPYEQNVEITRRVVEVAAPLGVTVESELGRVPSSEAGSTVPDEHQTDPDQAARFVDQTGIDVLAIAIGTAHGFYRSEPRLNLDRLAKIAEKVSLPLVLHGGSGVPDEQVLAAIRLGIAKVNVCTELIDAFARAYSRVQQEPGYIDNVPSLFGRAKEAAKALALKKIELFAGSG